MRSTFTIFFFMFIAAVFAAEGIEFNTTFMNDI
jgi:hypothetical protein